MASVGGFTEAEIRKAESYKARDYPQDVDPRVQELVRQLICAFADKWTMLIIDELGDRDCMRFSELSRQIPTISQKMLTQTLRRMERDGLIVRTVYACVPPKVEYRLTPIGLSLGAAFCGVWVWAVENLSEVERARVAFDGGGEASIA